VSNPEPGERSRPLRVAGLALLGIAVGALLVGLITLGSQPGGDGGSAGPTSTTAGTDTTTVAPPATSGQATETTQPTTTTPEPTPPQTTVAPPATTSAPPPAPPPPPTVPIRVYNNSTITGLAAQAADDFRRFGWTVVAVSNYPGGKIPTSTVYFRPGTEAEAAARQLAAKFNLRVEPRFEGIAGASPGLIVIVTNDYGSK